MLDYNINTFSNIVSTLPKFNHEQGDNKKWWTKQNGFATNPSITSAKEMSLKIKNCGSDKQVEAMIISDYSLE